MAMPMPLSRPRTTDRSPPEPRLNLVHAPQRPPGHRNRRGRSIFTPLPAAAFHPRARERTCITYPESHSRGSGIEFVFFAPQSPQKIITQK